MVNSCTDNSGLCLSRYIIAFSTKILGILAIVALYFFSNSKICPYQIDNDGIECKCDSNNGINVTVNTGEEFCYSSECANKINDCNDINGSLKYDSNENCPSCDERPNSCKSGSKIDNCKCDENRLTVKINDVDYCFSSDCNDTINDCYNKNGTFKYDSNENCPSCDEKPNSCISGSKIDNCKCDENRLTVEINDVDYCFSSDCNDTINDCYNKNGILNYDSNENCPSCEIEPNSCEDGSIINNCKCDGNRSIAEINGKEYCFPSNCTDDIEKCKENNGEFSLISNNNCPICREKCVTGLITNETNDCICDGEREKVEFEGENYCLSSSCPKITDECIGEITYDEKSQCLICSDDEVTPWISSAENVGIIVAVIVVILLLIAAIIFFVHYNYKDREVVALAQSSHNQNEPDYLVKNNEYNILPNSELTE
ncbi:MAG: hypothetical protein MHPSP_001920 [Paramarteilia canceri]